MKNILISFITVLSLPLSAQTHEYYFFDDSNTWSMSPNDSTLCLVHVYHEGSITEVYFQNYNNRMSEDYYNYVLEQLQLNIPNLACFEDKSYEKGRILYPKYEGNHVRYVGNKYVVSIPYILTLINNIL